MLFNIHSVQKKVRTWVVETPKISCVGHNPLSLKIGLHLSITLTAKLTLMANWEGKSRDNWLTNIHYILANCYPNKFVKKAEPN